jgi:hypothetical protein
VGQDMPKKCGMDDDQQGKKTDWQPNNYPQITQIDTDLEKGSCKFAKTCKA